MANKNFNPAQAGAKTDAQQVKKQNQKAAQSAGGYQSYESEFAAETNPQQVRQQNQQSTAKKQQNQQ